jgi:hypothetical protein
MMTNDVWKRWSGLAAIIAVTVIGVSPVMAASIATVQAAAHATLKKSKTNTFVPLAKRSYLNAGDVVRTGAKGNARLLLVSGSQIRLGQNSAVQLTESTTVKGGRRSFFRALAGQVYARLAPNSAVRTPTAVAGVRGTYIRLDVDGNDGTTVLTVLEGSVDFFNDFGEVIVKESQQSTAAPGTAPTNPIHVTTPALSPVQNGQSLTGESGLALNPTATGMGSGAITGQIVNFNFGDQAINNSTDEDGGNDDSCYGEGNNNQNTFSLIVNEGECDDNNAPAFTTFADEDSTDASKKSTFHYQGFTLAGRIAKHFELSGGVTRLRVSGPADNLTKTGIALGVKYLINPDSHNTRYAIGGGYDGALLDNFRAYAVASKPFGGHAGRAPVWGHLGIRYDQFDLEDMGGSNSKRVSVFTGIEYPLTRDGNLALTGEIQSKNNDLDKAKFPFSIGLHYNLGRSGVGFAAGYQRQGLIDDEGFYARVGYFFH